LRPPASNGTAPAEERLLAIRARDAADLMTRVSVLVARRGGALSSAISVRDAGSNRRTLAIVVTGAPRVVARLSLWISGLPDVLEVQDLTSAAEGLESAGPGHSADPEGEQEEVRVAALQAAAPAIHSQEGTGSC
jgi:acetolactate synthase regulatory subunit